MRVALSKWRNSPTVRIPMAPTKSTRLREGEVVELKSLREGQVTIRRLKASDRLINAIRSKNRHVAADWGPPRGKEIW